MKPILLLVIFFWVFTFSVKSQDSLVEKNANQVFYLEVLGIGGYGSLNYENVVFRKNKVKIGLRIGLSTYHIIDFTNTFNPDIIIPFSVNGFYGNKHNVEFGVGQTFSSIVQLNSTDYSTDRENGFSTSFTLGYRYQKQNGGIIFRIAYTPIIDHNKYYENWGGISIGYAF